MNLVEGARRKRRELVADRRATQVSRCYADVASSPGRQINKVTCVAIHRSAAKDLGPKPRGRRRVDSFDQQPSRAMSRTSAKCFLSWAGEI